MAIATYADLLASVAAWLKRPDLTAVIPDFVTLAESKFNKSLRTRFQVTRATTTLDEEWESLPSDYLEMVSLHLRTSPIRRLAYLSPAQFLDTVAGNAGDTDYYTILGDKMRFGPLPAGSPTLEIAYYAKLPALSNTSQTNWLLTKAPEIYLYGALCEAAPYLREDGRINTWATLLAQEFDKLNNEGTSALGAAGPLCIRSRGATP